MSQKRAPGRDGRAPSPRESRRRLAPRRRGRALPWPGGRDCALSAMSLKSCTYTPPDFPAPPDGRRRWLRCRPAASVANVSRTMASLSQPTTPGRTQRTVIVTGNRVRSHPKGLCAADDASQANESAIKKTDHRAAGRVGTRVTGWRGQRNRARVRIHLFHDPLFCFVVVTIQYLDGFSIFLKHQEAAQFSPPAPGCHCRLYRNQPKALTTPSHVFRRYFLLAWFAYSGIWRVRQSHTFSRGVGQSNYEELRA